MQNESNKIIKSDRYNWHTKRSMLAYEGENIIKYPNISSAASSALKTGIICDIFEGNAPYRPRYILPDYNKYINYGSRYLDIQPSKNLYEAINALLIIYRYVPSITGYPVYLGQVDELLEPFVSSVSNNELENLIKMFLINIDRTLSDSFVHMNIGPTDTIIGRKILKIERELKNAVPNISFKYSLNTSDELLGEVLKTSLEIGKPYIVNHDLISKESGSNYGIASCFNVLKIGGGSHTLVRLNLKKLSETVTTYDEFKNTVLPSYLGYLREILDVRTRFLVEESKFFEASFLANEGLIDIEKFTSMAGVFGLYECVYNLTDGLKMGKDSKAIEIAHDILFIIKEYFLNTKVKYCGGFNDTYGLHAQSGIQSDVDTTAGVRIKIGEEIDLYDQIKIQGELQKYFNAGVSDIYEFDRTAKLNIKGMIDIVKGAIKNNIKIMAINSNDSQLIRITGYLVKRCDVENYNNMKEFREDTVDLSKRSIDNLNILNRKIIKID